MKNIEQYNTKEWFAQIYNNSHIGIFIIDKNRHIIAANPRLCSMFGYRLDEVLLKTTRILHCDQSHFENFAQLALAQVQRGRPVEIDYPLMRKDGTRMWFHVCGDPISHKEDTAWILVDISARMELEKKLKAKTQLLQATQTLLRVGTWEIDLQTREITASDAFYQLMDFTLGSTITLESYLLALHPDDHTKFMKL